MTVTHGGDAVLATLLEPLKHEQALNSITPLSLVAREAERRARWTDRYPARTATATDSVFDFVEYDDVPHDEQPSKQRPPLRALSVAPHRPQACRAGLPRP